MRITHWISIAAALLLLALVAFGGSAWLESRDARVRLESELAAQKQVIAQAEQRQKERDANLAGALAEIETLKKRVQTPRQVV